MTQYNPKILVILKVSSILGPFKSFKVFWGILFILMVSGGGVGVFLVIRVISGVFLLLKWFQDYFCHFRGFIVILVIF